MQRSGLVLRGEFLYLRLSSRGYVMSCGIAKNGLSTAGVNALWEAQFRSGTQYANWYCGLIRDDNYSALSADDTMASHSGWEEGTEYSEGTRPAWSPGAASGKAVSNPTAMEFTISTEQTFKGLFICSDSTKSGSSGILWCTGLFDVEQSMPVGQVLKVYYTLSGREG